MNLFGFGGSSKRKNTKAARLRKKVSTLNKLQRKFNSPKAVRARQLDAAIAKADKAIQTLRNKR